MPNKRKVMNSAAVSLKPVKSALERYEEAVEILAKSRSEYFFQNDNCMHAAIVIQKIIEHSYKEVLIYDNDLSGDVADQSQKLLETISDAVRKDGKSILFVVRNKEESSDSRIVNLLRELAKLYPEKVRIKVASDEFIKAVDVVRQELGVNDINFAVGDTNSFRLEFPAGERKAFCSFNDKVFSLKLSSVFKTEFDKCEDYFHEQKQQMAI